jgi:hypothetical protein
MRPSGLRLAALALAAGCVSCVQLTPAESCTLICKELATCSISISGSSLMAGAQCEANCLALLEKNGAGCKGSAAYLADCFSTYSCTGNDVGCSGNARSFAQDCK